MFGFLKRSKKESSLDSQQKGRVLNGYQKQIDMFQVRNEQERRPSIPEVSFKQVEREAYDSVKHFQSLIKHLKQTNSSLEELRKMFKSGEITENAYKLIMSELTQDLSFSIESIFKLRDYLEVIKARAKLELIKEKGELKSVQPEQQGMIRSSQYIYQASYSSEISRWDEVISKIEAALSSMAIEEEISIIENYLYLIKDKPFLGRIQKKTRGHSRCCNNV